MTATVETPIASASLEAMDFLAASDFLEALSGDQRASAVYANLSLSCKREYLKWITSAKRPETRARRIANALAMIASGKQPE